MVFWRDKIILFPDMANMVVELDTNTGIMKKSEWLSALIKSETAFKKFGFLCLRGDVLYAMRCSDEVLLQIDLKSHEVLKRKLELSVEKAKFLWPYIYIYQSEKGRPVEKLLILDLKYMLKMGSKHVGANGLSGKTIYEYVSEKPCMPM